MPALVGSNSQNRLFQQMSPPTNEDMMAQSEAGGGRRMFDDATEGLYPSTALGLDKFSKSPQNTRTNNLDFPYSLHGNMHNNSVLSNPSSNTSVNPVKMNDNLHLPTAGTHNAHHSRIANMSYGGQVS